MTTLSLPCRDCRIRGWSQLTILWLPGAVLLGASGLLRLLMPALILLVVPLYMITHPVIYLQLQARHSNQVKM